MGGNFLQAIKEDLMMIMAVDDPGGSGRIGQVSNERRDTYGVLEEHTRDDRLTPLIEVLRCGAGNGRRDESWAVVLSRDRDIHIVVNPRAGATEEV